MKRDLDLIREILLQVEARGPKQSMEVEIEGRDRNEIFGHVQLLEEAGFVEVTFTGGPTSWVSRITWDGHEFLDSVRDSDVWVKVTNKMKEVGGTASFDIVKALAIGFVKEKLGLDGGE